MCEGQNGPEQAEFEKGLNPMMHHKITIGSEYCGPDGMANGGYVGGKIAAFYHRPVEITLRKPVPLGRALDVEWFEDVLLLCDGYDVIATAVPTNRAIDVPTPPSYQEAVHATRVTIPASEHPFPRCFVCGPAREEGAGLRLFPGPLEDRPMVAAPWLPGEALADEVGDVKSEFVHAALDCPGGFAAALGQAFRPAVLGRFSVRMEHPVRAGEPHVVVGWRIGGIGRKHEVGTALFNRDGDLCASARATWIELAKANGQTSGSLKVA